MSIPNGPGGMGTGGGATGKGSGGGTVWPLSGQPCAPAFAPMHPFAAAADLNLNPPPAAPADTASCVAACLFSLPPLPPWPPAPSTRLVSTDRGSSSCTLAASF